MEQAATGASEGGVLEWGQQWAKGRVLERCKDTVGSQITGRENGREVGEPGGFGQGEIVERKHAAPGVMDVKSCSTRTIWRVDLYN